MKKELSQLLKDLQSFQVYGEKKVTVTGISDNSGSIKKGDLFVAIKGATFDAHKFIPSAIKKGTAVVVGEGKPDKKWLNKVTYVKVANSRRALSLIASTWYGYPSKKMKLIGVTGTDGKTTTSNLIYWILSKSSKKTGLISTISAKIGKKEYGTGFHVTNPEPLLLQKFLSQMVTRGCKYAVLEVTSHGLDQERVAGVDFDIAVLTNITHEHLDYHKTWLDYFNTKAKLFKKVKTAVLNGDDIVVYEDIKCVVPSGSEVVSYGIEERGVDYFGENIKTKKKGTEFDIVYRNRRYLAKTKLFGDYNVSNILAASATVRELKIPWLKILSALSSFKTPVGRLEEIKGNCGFKVYIDFAHTPNSLENVLKTLRRQKGKGAKLISVFGCAGERDIEKRELMAKISIKLADISVFTAEDPRSEDIKNILRVMAEAAKRVGGNEVQQHDYSRTDDGSKKHSTFLRIPERGEAIAIAIQKLADKGDTVVICGKGHEKSMAYNGIEYPWSDHQAVELALRGEVKKIMRK